MINVPILKDLEKVLYSEAFIVLDPGDAEQTGLEVSQVISEDENENRKWDENENGKLDENEN